MRAKIKKIWDAVTTMLVVLLVLLAVILVGVRLFGVRMFSVLSGSMEPTYPVGALLYVRPVECTAIHTGDPITFLLNEDTVVTHRVIEVVPDEQDPGVLWYRTKGDANNVPDGGLVHCKNVLGVPCLSIPYLGYVANGIQNPPGRCIAVGAGAILLLLVLVPDLLFAKNVQNVSPKQKKRGTNSHL